MSQPAEYKEGKLVSVLNQATWGPPAGATRQRPRGLVRILHSAFIPEGYPESVSSDFSSVIAWHTVQAMSSYVRGILASHAVFLGLGVGSQAASALSAVFQFFVRDLVGMLGGIIFASLAGGNFDSNAKQWRLFADVTNNIGMALELAIPLFPSAFLLLASLGSIARAVVGMASGATHAALTQHFARANNAADVSAKADARERACNIVGSLVGMGFTHMMAEHTGAAWLVFLVLTWVHVWANIRALRCLVLLSLNEPRLQLLLHHYLAKEKVLTPVNMSGQESLLIPPMRSLWQLVTVRPAPYKVVFGASLSHVLTDFQQSLKEGSSPDSSSGKGKAKGKGKSSGSKSSSSRSGSSSSNMCPAVWSSVDDLPQGAEQGQGLPALLAAQFNNQEKFIIWVNPKHKKVVQVVVHRQASPQEQLQAYLLAHLACHHLHQQGKVCESFAELSNRCGLQMKSIYDPFMEALAKKGWDIGKLYLPRPTWTAEW